MGAAGQGKGGKVAGRSRRYGATHLRGTKQVGIAACELGDPCSNAQVEYRKWRGRKEGGPDHAVESVLTHQHQQASS